MTAEELDKRFDNGLSIMEYADLDNAVFRVNVDFPAWTVAELDKESTRLGISRQSLIKIWIADRLDQIVRGRKKAV
jgi:hypothetical protein